MLYSSIVALSETKNKIKNESLPPNRVNANYSMAFLVALIISCALTMKEDISATETSLLPCQGAPAKIPSCTQLLKDTGVS